MIPCLVRARCSCCSYSVKQLSCLFPFFAVAIAAVVLTGTEWRADCQQPPLHIFLLGSATLLVLFIILMLWVFNSRDKNKVRERPRKLLLVATWAWILTALAWAITGTMWVKQTTTCRKSSPHLYHSAIVVKTLLYAMVTTLGCYSVCCKIESCLDDMPASSFQGITKLNGEKVFEDTSDWYVVDSAGVEMTGKGSTPSPGDALGNLDAQCV